MFFYYRGKQTELEKSRRRNKGHSVVGGCCREGRGRNFPKAYGCINDIRPESVREKNVTLKQFRRALLCAISHDYRLGTWNKMSEFNT